MTIGLYPWHKEILIRVTYYCEILTGVFVLMNRDC